MSVVYTNKLFKNQKVLFAIVDQAGVKEKHERLFEKVFDITFSYTSRIAITIQAPVIFYKSIDEVMLNSEKYDLVIIQSVGNFIKDNRLLIYIEEYCNKNPDFFIVAFTLDWQSEKEQDWIEIHHQMLVVNPKTWTNLGSPKFGDWQKESKLLPNYIRSKENFHDNYTPYWIEGSTGYSVHNSVSQGWQFLDSALSNEIKIDNFSQEMRDCRLFVYPEFESNKLYQAFINRDSSLVTNPNQIKWIKSLTPKPTIWVYNSERYKFDINLSSCDYYFGPAAGFKYLDILNYNPECKFVLYDFSQLSLDWIENLKSNWNGKNFPKFLRQQEPRFQKSYKYIDTSIEKNQENLFTDFGNEENFIKLWTQFKNCEVHFVNLNLFNLDKVREFLANYHSKLPFFYYSNIFATDYTILNYSLQDINNYHTLFLNTIKNHFSNSITHGSDPLGKWITTK